MIEVSNLVKKYGDHTAVDHLSFQIEKGKIYGFLGPNGAGKSTFLKVLSGELEPSKGEVTKEFNVSNIAGLNLDFDKIITLPADDIR